MVLPYRRHPRSLQMMRWLTSMGCAFFLLDVYWGYLSIAELGDNWICVFFHYGWLSNLVPMNALVSVWLVILKCEKAAFDQQKEMMQFDSLGDAHCSSATDEQRIREAIAGSENEVETVIGVLLAAGAYTDNLRCAWDNGLDIEMDGTTDVRTGVFFSMFAWSVSAMDLLSDTR